MKRDPFGMTIKITLNGEEKQLENPTPLPQLLKEQGFTDGSFAVAVNGKFIPVESYSILEIDNGADIEVVAPSQGG